MDVHVIDLIKAIVICFTFLIVFFVFVKGVKNKWFSGLSVSKTGISIEAKQVEKEFQSGNILQLMNEHIVKCDYELIDYAVDRANFLRKTLANNLSKHLMCGGSCRAIVGVLRFPLYEAARRNNFKSVLKPEHIMWYVERLVKEIRTEYEEFAILQNNAFCVNNDNVKCPQIPDIEEIIPAIEYEVLENWALPIRRKTVDICNKKIEYYKMFAPSFQELNDQVKIRITEHCIEKNNNYIEALSRKPDPEKKER